MSHPSHYERYNRSASTASTQADKVYERFSENSGNRATNAGQPEGQRYRSCALQPEENFECMERRDPVAR